MLDNLSLIPEGTPEAIASVVNNLIDKLDKFCGWMVLPKGKRKDREEAFEFLKDSIMKDPKKPDYLKAMEIANIRKSFKEFENQNDIVHIALEEMTCVTSFIEEKTEQISEDWIDYFMDRARLINDESLKVIWGKILAEEVMSGGVNKKLLHILSVVSAEDAMNFNKVCSYFVKTENVNDADGYLQIFDFDEINIDIATRLDSLGLINAVISGIESFNTTLAFADDEEKVIIYNYKGKRAKIHIPDGKVKLGKFSLTKEGAVLQKIIVSEEKEDMIEYIFAQYPEERKEILQ